MRSPQPLADDVIDRLFSALTVRYGGSFLDRWRDLEIDVVKSDWAIELAGFANNLHALRFGLDHLPEKPPTVMDFKRLCHAMPPAAQGIAYDGSVRGPTPDEREALRELSRRIKGGAMFAKPGRQWADDLLRDHDSGWRGDHVFRATPTAVSMARDARRELSTTTEEPFA
ncbi:hypothetical protein [Variovorax sp.]|uniref:hypothetical protein n=1 Tax=Variovorax sp. TaxID=1871043 RepID=UPI003BAD0122